MKILHSSDWHLGKKLGPWSRLDEQKEVLQEILEICASEDPDLVLLSGDLYDSWNPPHEAIELLYRTLHKMTNGGTRPVIALAGNHDAPEHVEAPDALARECGIVFMGSPESSPSATVMDNGLSIDSPDPGMLILKDGPLEQEVRIICTPYANDSRMKRFLDLENRDEDLRRILEERWRTLAGKYFDSRGINIMAAHLFMARRGELLSEEEPEGEKSILHPGGLEQIFCDALPENCQYMALGHLHRPFPLQTKPVPAVYAGSPCAYSLSEKAEHKSLVLLQVEKGKPAQFRFLPLKSPWPLYREEFSNSEDAVSWLKDHPEGYVEITMKTEDYLSGTDKQKILRSHKRILSIIPDVTKAAVGDMSPKKSFAGKSVQEIFKDFYALNRQNSAVPEELDTLLNEILSGGDV